MNYNHNAAVLAHYTHLTGQPSAIGTALAHATAQRQTVLDKSHPIPVVNPRIAVDTVRSLTPSAGITGLR